MQKIQLVLVALAVVAMVVAADVNNVDNSMLYELGEQMENVQDELVVSEEHVGRHRRAFCTEGICNVRCQIKRRRKGTCRNDVCTCVG